MYYNKTVYLVIFDNLHPVKQLPRDAIAKNTSRCIIMSYNYWGNFVFIGELVRSLSFFQTWQKCLWEQHHRVFAPVLRK